MRRSGKSFLLDDFKKYVIENIKEANIISFDLSSLKYEELREYHALNDYVEKHYVNNKRNFLFIDEVQMCKGFELALNSLHASRPGDALCGANVHYRGLSIFFRRVYEVL